jgi:hypothetical protein
MEHSCRNTVFDIQKSISSVNQMNLLYKAIRFYYFVKIKNTTL